MILARLAVIGAVLCTLWFNGSYAYAKAAGHAHQLAMVAVALSIDLFKCAGLAAAARLYSDGFRMRAAAVLLLWPLAFGWSLYSGYASLKTNRTQANTTQEGDAERRSRAQTEYDQATTALATAKRSQLWEATAACTAPKTNPHKQFCDGITRTTSARNAAAAILDATKPVHVDPEVVALANVTSLSRDVVLFLIAAVPALILELLSSFGAYATSSIAPKPPRTPVGTRLRSWVSHLRPAPQTPPTPAPVTSPPPSPATSTWTIKR